MIDVRTVQRYALCLIVIGIPIGLMMFNRVGGIMTLLRY